MRARVIVLALALGMMAAFLTRGAGPPPPSQRVPARMVTLPRQAVPPPARVLEDTRDPFRYLDDSAPPPSRPVATSPADPEPEPPAPALRLVGLIRQGGHLRAALSIHGMSVTAAVGEMVEGYTVLSVDEDDGVRLQDPSGTEILLGPE
jgi:hypothetical protein